VIKLYIESDQRLLPLQSLELSIKQSEFISDWVLDSHQNSCFNSTNLLVTSRLHCKLWWKHLLLCRNWVSVTRSLLSWAQQHVCDRLQLYFVIEKRSTYLHIHLNVGGVRMFINSILLATYFELFTPKRRTKENFAMCISGRLSDRSSLRSQGQIDRCMWSCMVMTEFSWCQCLNRSTSDLDWPQRECGTSITIWIVSFFDHL